MISNIQRFSIHDGSGIRTTVFFKGCPLRCAWCSNPETQRQDTELLWKETRCLHCNKCVNACQYGALSQKNGKICLILENCCQCGECVTACCSDSIELSGREMSAEEILSIVLRDRPFYETSGGGMTISGGEPLSQPQLALELLKRAKSEGISTAIETCLCAPFASVELLLPWLDEIFFDIKHIDCEKHRQYTGVGNEQILENVRGLLNIRPDACARIPVIPGFNSSPEDIEVICNGLIQLGITRIELMRFHRLGAVKYAALGRVYQYQQTQLLSEKEFEVICQAYHTGGISTY